MSVEEKLKSYDEQWREIAHEEIAALESEAFEPGHRTQDTGHSPAFTED